VEHNLVSLTPLRLNLTDENWLEWVEQPHPFSEQK
jgi:hypothetical protein